LRLHTGIIINRAILNMLFFTAIDFETACSNRASICQVGLIRVENSEIVKEISLMVKPPSNYYDPYFTGSIHGIGPQNTESSPLFCEIWPEIAPYIKGQTVVAHNMPFDYSCLSQALTLYNIPVPEFKRECTYRMYGSNLKSLCRQYNIKLNHHDALSDSRACAMLYINYFKTTGNIPKNLL